MHYVYVLESLKTKSLYVGYTTNLKKRLSEHNCRLNLSTRAGAPWKIIFFEGHLNGNDAKRREKYLKTNHGSRLLKLMLRDYFTNIN